MNLIQQGVASLHRVQELLAVEPAIRDAPEAEAPPPIAPGAGVAVRFEQVDLALGGRPVLEGISFELPPGGFLGVVGPTGSGKSSLLALLARVYDPTAGRVLLDGRVLRAWPLAELRRQVGYAPQETLLFSIALRENVAFGLEEVDKAALQRAVSIARLEQDLPQLVDGIDTVVGERGVTLSGGQKQRTAIARALLKDPCLLVLDDALASVDADTEVAILAGLREAMRGRTSVIASHRLTAVREADLILVLDGGRVVERGTHAELLAEGGLYARLYRRQQLSEALEHVDGAAGDGKANGQATSWNGVTRARSER
jgi:ATP-binding cassette subfamily B protein